MSSTGGRSCFNEREGAFLPEQFEPGLCLPALTGGNAENACPMRYWRKGIAANPFVSGQRTIHDSPINLAHLSRFKKSAVGLDRTWIFDAKKQATAFGIQAVDDSQESERSRFGPPIPILQRRPQG